MQQGKTEKVSPLPTTFRTFKVNWRNTSKTFTQIWKEIQQEITSHEFKYKNLQEVVAMAERYETHHSPQINKPDWQLSAMSAPYLPTLDH